MMEVIQKDQYSYSQNMDYKIGLHLFICVLPHITS